MAKNNRNKNVNRAKAKKVARENPAMLASIVSHTKADLYEIPDGATPQQRLHAYLLNLINSPRFLEAMAISEHKFTKVKYRLLDPFLSPKNLPVSQEKLAIFPNIPTKAPEAFNEEIAHVIRGSKLIDKFDGTHPKIEDCLIACGVQDIELEQERLIGGKWHKVNLANRATHRLAILEVTTDVFLYKCQYPDGRIRWSIKAVLMANDFASQCMRAKGVSRKEAFEEENLLQAVLEVHIYNRVEDGIMSEREIAAFERLMTWEVVVELLKHEARCSIGKEERCYDPLLHMEIEGFLFGMRKIGETADTNDDEVNHTESTHDKSQEKEASENALTEKIHRRHLLASDYDSDDSEIGGMDGQNLASAFQDMGPMDGISAILLAAEMIEARETRKARKGENSQNKDKKGTAEIETVKHEDSGYEA